MDREPAAPPRRRRWPSIVAVSVVAVVGALGAYVSQYEPLENSFTVGHPGATGRDISEAHDPGLFILRYRDGDTFGLSFDLHNRGPLPVTVTGVRVFAPDEPDLVGPVEAVDVLMGPPGEMGLEVRDALPFEPFRLAGEERRVLIARGRFDDCEHHIELDGISFGFHDAVVRYRVLGISKEARVPLLVRFELPLKAEDCPPA